MCVICVLYRVKWYAWYRYVWYGTGIVQNVKKVTYRTDTCYLTVWKISVRKKSVRYRLLYKFLLYFHPFLELSRTVQQLRDVVRTLKLLPQASDGAPVLIQSQKTRRPIGCESSTGSSTPSAGILLSPGRRSGSSPGLGMHALQFYCILYTVYSYSCSVGTLILHSRDAKSLTFIVYSHWRQDRIGEAWIGLVFVRWTAWARRGEAFRR